MSRFTVAIDLEDLRKGKRRRKKTRKPGSHQGVRKPHGGRQGQRETRGNTRQPDLVKAIPFTSKRHKPGPARRGRDAMRGEEDTELHEAELTEGELEGELEAEVEADLGAERRGLKDRLQDAASRDWQRPIDLGANLRIQTRPGTRAAVVEVKPGLFVVAEVPTESVEFGFGPMLLAPALIKTLGRALQGQRSAGGAGRAHRPELPQLPATPAPKQLPGPTQDEPQTEGRLAPWLDDDLAEELGCPCEVRRDRRRS